MFNPTSPTKYTGSRLHFANIVTRQRRPTSSDVFQPETGKLYVLFCGWQVGKNPTTGSEGELWLLSKIVANVATWVMISGGNVGTVVSLTGDDSIEVSPDVNGTIFVTGQVVDNATYGQPLYVTNSVANTEQWAIQKAVAVTPTPANANSAGVASFDENDFSVDATSGMVSLLGTGKDYHVARYIVSAGGEVDGANYTTISSAYAAAVIAGAPQTIFIQPGTYTEDITLTAGINLTAFNCDATTPNVTIVGKTSMTTAGTVSISGIRLQTNSDYLLSVTGSAASKIILNGCFLNATDNSAILMSSSGGATIQMNYCLGNLATTGINYFTLSNSSDLNMRYCYMQNSSGSTTTSTVGSGCNINFSYTLINTPIQSSGTSAISLIHCRSTNQVLSIDHGGTSSSIIANSHIGGSAAVAAINISAGATLSVTYTKVTGYTPNIITGAGTIKYAFLAFDGTGTTITTTTQTAYTTA